MSRSSKRKTVDVSGIEAYILGDSFTDKEKEELAPWIAGLNSAAVQIFGDCARNSERCGISVKPSRLGKGLFCGKKIGLDNTVAVYYGTLEKASNYFGRLDYAIELPRLKVSGKSEVIYLCGFDRRDAPFNAVMLNHVCDPEKANVLFKTAQLVLYAHPELRLLKSAKEATCGRMFHVTQAQIDEELFSYFIVTAVVIRRVAAGDEFLVSYNRPNEKMEIDHMGNYFLPEKMAEAVAKRENNKRAGSDHILCPCMCEPGGCPGGRFYVFNRALLSAASSAQSSAPLAP